MEITHSASSGNAAESASVPMETISAAASNGTPSAAGRQSAAAPSNASSMPVASTQKTTRIRTGSRAASRSRLLAPVRWRQPLPLCS